MKKRTNAAYAEKVDEFNTAMEQTSIATDGVKKLLEECDEAITMISNLSELMRVIDLNTIKYQPDFHEPVTWGLRAYGQVLDRLTSDAGDALDRAKRELGLPIF